MNSKIQVLPYNLTEEEYPTMLDNGYEGELVTEIVIIQSPRVLPTTEGARRLEFHKTLKPVMDMLDKTPMPGGGRTMFDFKSIHAAHSLWELLSPAQHEWLTGDCYVQVGFYPADIVCCVDLGSFIGNSLTLYDILVSRHHSVETMDHQAVELPSNQIRELSIEMGNVYQNNMAFLPRRLLPFRNKVASMARAALAGQDPVAAYHQHLERADRHFLSVEMIPFSPEKDIYTTDGHMACHD